MGKYGVTWARNGLRTPETSNSALMAPYGEIATKAPSLLWP